MSDFLGARVFITFFLLLSAFSHALYADEGNFCSSRYAFPTTCEAHFADNVITVDSWVEADDENTISSLNEYLSFIPKCYEADCCHCFDCGGVKFNLYRGCDFPTDSYDTLWNFHTRTGQGLIQDCENDSDHCESLCWNGGYFRRWNHKYIHFFNHFLTYSSENCECDCYWPELDEDAVYINDIAYDLLKALANKNLLSRKFSPFWKATSYFYNYGKKIYPDEYYPNANGMASSLTTYTFFYSQYHQMLLSVASFIDAQEIIGNSKAIDRIYSTLEKLREEFSFKYNRCLKWHPHPKIYYERGMLKMHSGNFEDALTDVSRLMRLTQTEINKNKFNLTSEMYHQEGQIYVELGMYDQAINALTQAIQLDPNNRGAYFHRAQAYFETEKFDESISDYLSSNLHNDIYETRLKPPMEIKEAILKGLLEGGKEASINFFPSLCESAYGLGSSLWVFAEHPIDSTTNFVNASYDISKNIYQFFKDIDLNDMELYVEEIQRIYGNFDKLSEAEKAHLTGYLIGKYGVDIFAGSIVLKGVVVCKKLKDANRIANLETLAASEKSKQAVKAAALAHASNRETFFKNIKIHWGRQNKHVPGTNNYQQGKSILTHNDPQSLLKEYAGRGNKVRGNAGELNYQEIVNFGESIGYNVDKDGFKTFTTWGKIHYSKDGAHIVPTMPRE